jgi:hypothetical protein
MTAMENRLRDACQEAADTVSPQAIRGLDLEPGEPKARTLRAATTRRPGRLMGPLAAAVAVAVIAVGAFVVVPRLAGGTPGHAHRARHAQPPVLRRLAVLPKYTVFINGNALDVVVTATGHVTGQLSAPARQGFTDLAGTASDRTFFVATQTGTKKIPCQTMFYQFSLGADGQPSALTPLPVGSLLGLPTSLAASANGSLVAYSVVLCAGEPGDPVGTAGLGRRIGHIGLIDLAAGKITRQWSYTLDEDYTSDLSMSADGTLVGYSNYLGNVPGAGNVTVGRVLAASAPSGPDASRGRVVIRRPSATTLSASGHLMYALTGTAGNVLAAYDTANGRRVEILRTWRVGTQPSRLVADPAGHYALAPISIIIHLTHVPPNMRERERACIATFGRKSPDCKPTQLEPRQFQIIFFSINLATGALTKLPFHAPWPSGNVQVVAW